MSIGLTMIVRDEAETIGRSLLAAKPLVDHWTIVDTGSTDKTKAKIVAALQDIPGELHERPWRSHAENRSELLQLAQGTADYLFCLDADLLLHQEGPLPELTADEYLIRIRTAGDYAFEQQNPLLIRGDLPWRYEGGAHAYLCCDRPVTTATLENVWLEETRDASPRADKIQLDAQRLEAELSPRTIFYLAQSYADLGHDTAAADLYRLRVRLSAQNPEEVFWACYREALLRIKTDFDRGVGLLLEAWQRRPTRAEPLCILARYYRLRGHHETAFMFADRACRIQDTTDRLFVLRWVYQWGSKLERALANRALGNTAAALVDLHALAALPLIGEPAEWVANNLADLDPLEVSA